ncbi:MAG TPA: aminodeoxychorismate synthase component I [Gammaproteobacteria bacterium]|nr:aminodeoxychorismate synthase component I [Gammaproteobacteria bacterium]
MLRSIPWVDELLDLHRLHPRRYPCLLESVLHGTPRARYDILFAFPGETLRLNADLRLQGPWAEGGAGDFLKALDRWWHELHQPAEDSRLPFHGGWFLFLAYELAAQVEPVLRLPLDASSPMPVACAVRCPAAVIRDHAAGRCWLVAEAGEPELLDAMAMDLEAAKGLPAPAEVPALVHLEEEPADRYLQALRRIHEYILAGDVFQVNLSRLWEGRLETADVARDAALYHRLRTANPAPFAGMLTIDGCAVLSSSPERLVAARHGRVETRPIAGTAARREDESSLERRLRRHPKERAEHIMLIDLERNDLGRICIPGSVKVDELLALESYAYVHHLVSNVSGTLRDGVTPGEVIRAVFPGGTITGCPKVRCMEIIAELEAAPRGAYTGALGYLNRDGSLDLNILIRTLVRQGRKLTLRAGAGIVADSVPERELAETRAKARGMLAALGVDEKD